ncbi:ubiquitin-like domain-containing protein, partial [Streptomyces violascens]|uniref:ubiquitin-like domain-containing protein n=1 Tax=Streptomyces violascens TaxID=67381 RepID=UPI0036ABD8C4
MSNSQGSHRAARGGHRAGTATATPPYGVATGAAEASAPPFGSRVPRYDGFTPSYADHETLGAPVSIPEPREPVPLRQDLEPGGRAGARRAARRRKSSGGPDALRRLLPQALVVAFLAGGTSAFVVSDKAVRLTVDGVPRTMHTFADSVDELLADEHVPVGTHDLVAPGPAAGLAGGAGGGVGYGRPVELTHEGPERQG